MTRKIVNKSTAVDDMLADLDLSAAETAATRAILDDVAGLATDLPAPSPDLQALLSGAVPLRRRRRRGAYVAVAAGALALGGVSAAAAANRLPDPIQEIVANATEGVLPVDVPHPVKPVNPPYDAPGHLRNKPKTPKPTHPTAPGQIQKATKPDPLAPGPAHPADPGAHGRAHHANRANSPSDHESDDVGDADRPGQSDQHNGVGNKPGKS